MTLEKLQVIIEAYTKPYRDEMEKVKQQTQKVTNEVDRQVKHVSTQVEKHTSKISNSLKKAGLMIASVLSIGAIVAFGKSCIDLGSDLQEVQNVVDVTFGVISGKVNEFAREAAESFGLSETMAKKYMGTYGAMAKAFDITGQAAYEMSAAITGLTGDVASFYNLSQDEAYTKLKSIFTGETESLKDLGVVMTQTALNQYALNNGFGKTTAKMTEQEKVMLRYQFVMSQLSDASGDFARTSGSWANQVRVLQLQFESLKATIGQGLINAFTPVIQVINTILAKLQTLANYFKAFTQALFGNAGGSSNGVTKAADAMSRAAGGSGAVADNMADAAGSAKKLKEYTLGIDELNVLKPDDGGDSGGSGGGGGAAPDFGSMEGELFGNVTVNPEVEEAVLKMKEALDKLKEIAKPTTDALKKLWDEGLSLLGGFAWETLVDFYEYFLKPIGLWTLGEGLPRFIDITNDFFKKIDWDRISEALKRFWKALEPFAVNVGRGLLDFYADLSSFGADFINLVVPGGLNALSAALESISPETAREIGYALGLIATALIALKGIGIVAAGIRALGAAIKAFPGLSTITGLFSGLGELSGSAFWTGLGASLSNLAMGLGGPGTASFDVIVFTILGWINDSLANLLPDWVTDFFKNLVSGIVAGAVAGSWIPGLGTAAGAIVGGIIGALNGITIDGNSVLAIIGQKIFNFDYASSLLETALGFFNVAFASHNFLEIGANIIAGIAAGLTAGIAAIGEPIIDLLAWIIEAICSVFGIHSPAEAMKPYGKYILLGLIEGFRGTFDEWTASLDEWYNTYISPWFTVQKWSELYSTIKTEMKNTWDSAVITWSGDIVTWWDGNVSPWFTAEKWLKLYETIKTKLKETWTNTSNTWKTDISNWWNQNVSPWFTLDKWLQLYDTIKTGMKTKWDETWNNWKTDLSSWWTSDVMSWFTLDKWNDALANIPDAFKKAFKSAVDAARSIINGLIDWLNDHMKLEIPEFEVMGESFGGYEIQLFKIPRIPELASGGIVSSGQLFIANEKGPELVGRYGNQSAVMNNKQIVDAVSNGVATAMANVMAAFQGDNTSTGEQTINLVLDGRTIASVSDKTRKRQGYNFKLRTV